MGEAPGGAGRPSPARPADAARLAALAAQTLPTAWSREAWAAELARPDARVLVVRHAGAREAGLLGLAAVRLAAGTAELLALAVAPRARRRGLGRALLRDALMGARTAGATRVDLEVPAGAAAARRLYAQCGFVAVGRRPRYYAGGEDAILMTLEPARHRPLAAAPRPGASGEGAAAPGGRA